jgi:hypothetical protein
MVNIKTIKRKTGILGDLDPLMVNTDLPNNPFKFTKEQSEMEESFNEMIKGPSTKGEKIFVSALPKKHKPTLAEVQTIFEKPRNPKWEEPVSENPTFNVNVQREKLRKTIQEHKEDFYKGNVEEDYVPTGRLNYKDNLFEKMFGQQIKVQNELIERSARASERLDKLDKRTEDRLERESEIAAKIRKETINAKRMSGVYDMLSSMGNMDKKTANYMKSRLWLDAEENSYK